jgi:UDP:flavonoid glycosyltransferase YjiC (YdhE family)
VGHEVGITFLSHGSWFEPYIRDAGFDIIQVQPRVRGLSAEEDMRSEPPELIGSVELARAFIEGQRQAIREVQPDVVLHSFWQPGNLAARLEGIPTVSFLPVPPSVVVDGLHQSRLGLVVQNNITQAIIDAGWPGSPPATIYDQIAADLTIVNDVPQFYSGIDLPADVHVTGPLYAQGSYGTPIDQRLVSVLTTDDGRPKVLLTMGSSGSKQAIIEAVNAVATTTEWDVIILASPTIIDIDEIQPAIAGKRNIYVTDQFIPAVHIAELVDCVVSHGGQATIQTALAGGAPIVGVAMQMEQQINLDHIVQAGAAIRIPIDQWRQGTIQNAIRTVVTDPAFRMKAHELAHTIHTTSGRRQAAENIWEFIQKGLSIPTLPNTVTTGEFPI